MRQNVNTSISYSFYSSSIPSIQTISYILYRHLHFHYLEKASLGRYDIGFNFLKALICFISVENAKRCKKVSANENCSLELK